MVFVAANGIAKQPCKFPKACCSQGGLSGAGTVEVGADTARLAGMIDECCENSTAVEKVPADNR